MITVNHFTDYINAGKHAHKYDALISIGFHGPAQEPPERVVRLKLDFKDITSTGEFIEPSLAHDPLASVYTGPTEEHIRTLVSFIKDLAPTDKLLIHCFAGYSRSSAATAIAKCVRDGITIDAALVNLGYHRIPDQLVPKPNDIMIKLFRRIQHTL